MANVNIDTLNMFKNMEKTIGKKVICIWFRNGIIMCEQGILDDVNYYNGIIIDGHGIPFVDVSSAISSVFLSETGENLYFNSLINKDYALSSTPKKAEIKRKTFGEDVVFKQGMRKYKKEKSLNDKIQRKNFEVKAEKMDLMKEGLPLVKLELGQNWLRYVNKNVNDLYSFKVVKTVVEMLKKLEEGKDFEEAEKEVCNELNISGYILGGSVGAVCFFSRKGDEYKKYWYKKFGYNVGEEYLETSDSKQLTFNQTKTK